MYLPIMLLCGDVKFALSSAIHEFPEDLFSNDERKSGAVVLHILAVNGLYSTSSFFYDAASASATRPVPNQLLNTAQWSVTSRS